MPQIAKWCVAPELLAELRPLSEVRSPYWCRWTQPVSANVSHVLASQRSPSLSLRPPPLPFSSSFVGSSSLPPSLLRDAARSSSCASVRLFILSPLARARSLSFSFSINQDQKVGSSKVHLRFHVSGPIRSIYCRGDDAYVIVKKCRNRRTRARPTTWSPVRVTASRSAENSECDESFGRACRSMQPLVRTVANCLAAATLCAHEGTHGEEEVVDRSPVCDCVAASPSPESP